MQAASQAIHLILWRKTQRETHALLQISNRDSLRGIGHTRERTQEQRREYKYNEYPPNDRGDGSEN